MEEVKQFYRYELRTYASMSTSEHSEEYYTTCRLQELIYNLHKETPKGYWIGYGRPIEGELRSKSTWVSKTAKKRYAYPTKEEALDNYIKRALRYKYLLENKLSDCKYGLNLADKLLKENEVNDNLTGATL
jgi:hypothetical protein